jgi:hypothetical protein
MRLVSKPARQSPVLAWPLTDPVAGLPVPIAGKPSHKQVTGVSQSVRLTVSPSARPTCAATMIPVPALPNTEYGVCEKMRNGEQGRANVDGVARRR